VKPHPNVGAGLRRRVEQKRVEQGAAETEPSHPVVRVRDPSRNVRRSRLFTENRAHGRGARRSRVSRCNGVSERKTHKHPIVVVHIAVMY
jgi:hypothetical protein